MTHESQSMDPPLRIHSRFVVVPVVIGEDREKSAVMPKKCPTKFYVLFISLVLLLVLVVIAMLVVGLLSNSSCEGKRGDASGYPTSVSPQEENRAISDKLWSRDQSGESFPSYLDTVAPPLKSGDTIEMMGYEGDDSVGILVIQQP